MDLKEAAALFCQADAAYKASLRELRNALDDTDAKCPVNLAMNRGEAVETSTTCGTCRGSGTHPYGGECDCDGGAIIKRAPANHNRCFRVYDYDDWCEGCHVTQEFATAKREASKARGAALRRLLYWGKPQKTLPLK